MQYFTLLSSYPDHTITSAWDSQIRAAADTPWLTDALAKYGDDIFRRFAARYAELCTLPRNSRRALQRQLARSSEITAILSAQFSPSPSLLVSQSSANMPRRLQHRMAWSLAGAALLLALGQGAASAATITVTTSNPNVAVDGQCSLIEAIVNANDDAATHPDCAAGSGADKIILPPNANITLSTSSGTLYGVSIGLPPITGQITIEGNGATIARQAGATSFSLIGVIGNFSPPLVPGNLTIERVTLTGANSLAALFNNGTLNIKNSVISGNESTGVVNQGILTIDRSTISNNTSALFNNRRNATITNSTIAGNAPYYSAPVVNYYGSFTIENSTISDNSDRGLDNVAGNMTVINSTISGNMSGGIGNFQYCYFSCHSATLTIKNSIVTGNRNGPAPEIANFNSTVNANNFNLFGYNGTAGVSGFTPGPTDLVPGIPVGNILGPLQNNGGPTQTRALVTGSPAIDAADPGGCRSNAGALLLRDQRGFRRHFDGNDDGTIRCDIGALEFGAGSLAPVDIDGDGLSDIGVYRNGAWSFLRSSDAGNNVVGWGGGAQDKVVPADYDGDGKIDIAIYRVGAWSIVRSSDGANTVLGWGGAAQDVLIPADYDGDGKTDIAVYRDGVWSILRTTDGGNTIIGWGGDPQDIPVPADYDGDGKTDIAIYRVNLGVWSIKRSSDSGNTIDEFIGFGFPQDIPVAADYDGDGKADIALYRDGTWVIRLSSTNSIITTTAGGQQGEPVPADYDGDGKADVAIYQNGVWTIKRSSDGAIIVVGWGGAAEDIPVN